MEYQTFQPHKDLSQFVKYYWTLKVPKEPNSPKQRIVPDGSIEMIFTLGDDVKRFVSDTKYIIQPRFMVLGQITEPFYIEPMGIVDTFAICFFPGGFIPFTKLHGREQSRRLFNELTGKVCVVNYIPKAKIKTGSRNASLFPIGINIIAAGNNAPNLVSDPE